MSMSNSENKSQVGKVWFITGASSGFGRLLAEHLFTLGANVVATARNIDTLSEFTTKHPANSLILSLDVTKPDSIAKAHDDAIAHFGRIDVLVNNAGYGLTGAIEEVTDEEFMPMFDTNVLGLIHVTKAFLPDFRKQHSGNIVNISSIAGLVGSPGWGYYNATKFAVEGISDALTVEMEPFGVHVTVIEPGPFRTDFLGRSGKEAALQIADYQPTAGKTREYFHTQAGKQAGDPQKAVEAIVAAVSAPNPPKRLLLGKFALNRFRGKIDAMQKEIAEWETTTIGADFPEGS
jgi:NAD(P)-dependent dehydrogenase (short-subunit alcohol dehydrogenase family)